LDKSFKALEAIISDVRQRRPFEVMAWVILPDHMHCIWELPDGDVDYSVRWALIKKDFTKMIRGSVETPEPGISRTRKREGTVWQRRFWEHKIRDDFDLQRHIEYIHYNPVRHGYVSSPNEWKLSSFREYVERGLFPFDWGGGDIEPNGIRAE
jgi:putative transposase